MRFYRWAESAIREKSKANAIIVLINTALTIGLSVVTIKFVVSEARFTMLGVDAAIVFTVVGVTLLTFVLGETVPKQLALKYRFQILYVIGAIPNFFAKGWIVGLLAHGLTYPFALLGAIEE
jgi:CBS domain containing-hemolysin-like protein